MVILSEGEKKQTSKMGNAKKYCVFPSTKKGQKTIVKRLKTG